MDLFDYMRQTNQEKEAPLAARRRAPTPGGGRGA